MVIGVVKLKIHIFVKMTLSHDRSLSRYRVTRWLWSTRLKSHLAKIGDHCPSEGGDEVFFNIM